jgi:hypothetical protein
MWYLFLTLKLVVWTVLGIVCAVLVRQNIIHGATQGRCISIRRISSALLFFPAAFAVLAWMCVVAGAANVAQFFTLVGVIRLALWPCSWTFTVQHAIYVKCEYFMNQEGKH